MGVIAVLLAQSAATTQEAIKFVDELIERCVAIFAGDAGNQVGTANLDVSLGDELLSDATGLIKFKVNPHADNLIIVMSADSLFVP